MTSSASRPDFAPVNRGLGLPPDFVWGVSTSSYQIEGGASDDGRLPSIWDTRCRLGKIRNQEHADVACDHYHRYGEDIALMKQLGVAAYRFSTAWPRVLPRGKGRPNEAGLDFYDRLVDGLLEAGIEPWLCLYHWDLPQALQDLGGWTVRDAAGWFADYTALMARRYGDRVKKWITFNEFSVFTMFGYMNDWSAPGIADRQQHLKAIHHVNLAHGAGVDVIRSLVKDSVVGAVHNRQAIHPEKDCDADRAAAKLFDEHWNGAFPDPQLLAHYPPQLGDAIEPYVQAGDMARICRPLDFFGLNHYSPIYARATDDGVWGIAFGNAPEGTPLTHIGWPINPEAFRDELLSLSRRYKLPIFVTENGCGSESDSVAADGGVHDQHRVDFLRRYTGAMRDAVAQGADVRGYFVWSLLDNFEWGNGLSQRFGLIHVDYQTLVRTRKDSFHWFAGLISGQHRGE